MSFGEEVAGRRFPIKNRPEIYGEQLIVDHEDNILGSDPKLLVVATGIALDEVPELVERHGGVCYPAHIDRPSNGIIAILGDIPPDFPTECVELNDMSKREELMKSHPSLSGKKFLSGPPRKGGTSPSKPRLPARKAATGRRTDDWRRQSSEWTIEN